MVRKTDQRMINHKKPSAVRNDEGFSIYGVLTLNLVDT